MVVLSDRMSTWFIDTLSTSRTAAGAPKRALVLLDPVEHHDVS
jgi:hypothetical protein